MIRVILALICLLTAASAHAGYVREIPLDSGFAPDGTGCARDGAFAGTVVPRCDGNVDGYFYFKGPVRTLGSAPTFDVDLVRLTATNTVAGPNDKLEISIACVVATEDADPATLDFAAATKQTLIADLTDETCVSGLVCHVGPFATAVALYNDQTGANCATTACNEATMVCQLAINGDTTNAYPDDVDLESAVITFAP